MSKRIDAHPFSRISVMSGMEVIGHISSEWNGQEWMYFPSYKGTTLGPSLNHAAAELSVMREHDRMTRNGIHTSLDAEFQRGYDAGLKTAAAELAANKRLFDRMGAGFTGAPLDQTTPAAQSVEQEELAKVVYRAFWSGLSWPEDASSPARRPCCAVADAILARWPAPAGVSEEPPAAPLAQQGAGSTGGAPTDRQIAEETV